MKQTEKVGIGTDRNREITHSLEIPESDSAIKCPLPLTAECVNDLESEWTVLLDARSRIDHVGYSRPPFCSICPRTHVS